jgi:hypothetical protein
MISLVLAARAVLAAPEIVKPQLEFVMLARGRDTILLLRDCRGPNCRPWETQFNVAEEGYEGDAVRLDRELSRRDIHYKEVWLQSGGGHLNEGLAVGRVLRQHGATVRVPMRATCASSCTVAFLGGLFRLIDDSTSFVVHSASSVMSGLDESTALAARQGRFRDFYDRAQARACERSLELLQHFQQSLLLLKGVTAPPPRVGADRCRPGNAYSESAEGTDAKRVEVEGLGAAQAILMRLERESMLAALTSWRAQVALLGERAGPAIRMVEAMYDTSILDGSDLNHETLLRLGYVTQLVDRSAQSPP